MTYKINIIKMNHRMNTLVYCVQLVRLNVAIEQIKRVDINNNEATEE